jgi:hypothetical protein
MRGSGDGEEGVDEVGGEGVEFGGAFGSDGDFVFFADEPVAVGLDGSRGELTLKQIGGFAVERESGGGVGSEQRAAIPFSDSDVLLVHREGDHREAAGTQAVEDGLLLSSQFHRKNCSSDEWVKDSGEDRPGVFFFSCR